MTVESLTGYETRTGPGARRQCACRRDQVIELTDVFITKPPGAVGLMETGVRGPCDEIELIELLPGAVGLTRTGVRGPIGNPPVCVIEPGEVVGVVVGVPVRVRPIAVAAVPVVVVPVVVVTPEVGAAGGVTPEVGAVVVVVPVVVVVVVGRVVIEIEILLEPPTELTAPSRNAAKFGVRVVPRSTFELAGDVLTMPSRRPVDAVEDEKIVVDAAAGVTMLVVTTGAVTCIPWLMALGTRSSRATRALTSPRNLWSPLVNRASVRASAW